MFKSYNPFDRKLFQSCSETRWPILIIFTYVICEFKKKYLYTFHFHLIGERIPDVFKFHVLITTYECLITDIMELREIDWRSCVIDEAHRLKNAKCQLLECLNLLSIESRCLLSGTPLQNNINELYSLLSFLEPTQFNSQESFMKEFGDMQNEDQVNKLQAILKPLMLRRMKEDVEKSLKPKTETIVEVELTNIQKKYYRAILERNFAFLNKGKLLKTS